MCCSDCGKCCEKTEMELSSDDIKRLEEAGHRRVDFALLEDGVTRLRNVVGGHTHLQLSAHASQNEKKRKEEKV